ncbi:anthranilate phosphoribosyltransferase [Silvibacterium dinghuense]|uniref:Anthranilate phosphoribosyltransferase n=1 Tax=Silvibacterium dinghuense TaxID=1560006 RepID=A0A4Q1S908_9BACT|nr:anthranilate phosphoribosyltransferase [Silvibacterium dinghuense]RXS93379.1 anthranilate phosphoribosyltransferase [Silvibacterium dinghuense]GGH05337.1 anthranilate phosphoribosyltransferase [Silvibacterium dinghuense]
MAGLKQVLRLVVEQGATLGRDEARRFLTEILESEPGQEDMEIAALLTALSVRGETADELTGFAEAMRARATPIPLTDAERSSLVDTCGTGGTGRGTFNISTCAALVAVAAGAKVAKHGNRAVTSKCGSADVVEALGLPLALTPERAAECLRETGFMFLLAPAFHPAMKRMMTIRRSLGFRTIFNQAGPLTNPAGARAQVMGVASARMVPTVAEAMARLGVSHAFVAHGSDGIDEITITGETSMAEVAHMPGRPDANAGSVRLYHVQPEDFGLERASLADLAAYETAVENAQVLEQIFAGEPGPKRQIVVLNAAAALVAAGVATDFREGLQRAAEAIDSGEASAVVKKLRAFAAETAERN